MAIKSEKGFAIFELIAIVIAIAIIAAVVWLVFDDGGGEQNHPNMPPPPEQPQQAMNQNPEHDLYPTVWTKNGYDGPSYEYKVNCGMDYKKLKTCFLWNLSKVVVTDPKGGKTELNKDFNVNSYSGEVTRRWVLYGEADTGFPKSGEYKFNYYKKGKLVFSQNITYKPDIIAAPTNIKWKRKGNDLHVSWTAPKGIKEGNTYKVIIFRENGVISQLEQWDATSAILKNLPLKKGEKVGMNVSSYFGGGYAYPESIPITW